MAGKRKKWVRKADEPKTKDSKKADGEKPAKRGFASIYNSMKRD